MFFALLVYVGMLATAWASVSVNGSFGGIDAPGADVLRPGQCILFKAYLEHEKQNGMSFSIAPQLAFTMFRTKQMGVYTERLGIKHALREEGVLKPGLAVGITDLAGKAERSAYVVRRKGLPEGSRFHLGLGGGFFSLQKQLGIRNSIGFSKMDVILECSRRHMYKSRSALTESISIMAGVRADRLRGFFVIIKNKNRFREPVYCGKVRFGL